jgi:Methyltransferase domain
MPQSGRRTSRILRGDGSISLEFTLVIACWTSQLEPVAVLLAAAERGHGRQLVGVDLTPAMLQRPVNSVAFEGQSFDVVLSSFAFLSISDKQRALAEFREFKGRLFDGLAQCRQPDGLIHGTLQVVLARGQDHS